MPRTPLCAALGIEHPILSVGFGAGAGSELVAAVSNAGGLGVLGGVSNTAPEYMAQEIARTRRLTKRPFGVNVIVDDRGRPEVASAIRELFQHVVEQGVDLVVLFAGDPTPYVEPAHVHGAKVMIQVGSPEEARRAAAAGVDFVIAQGREAGGHVIARSALFVNLPAIVDAVAPLPVLASGGIADGRGLAAALALGAQGVSLGTRFVATEEAFLREEYKQRVVASRADDTFYSEFLFDGGWAGVPHRALKARAYEEWAAAGMPPSGARPGEGERIGVLRRPWGDADVRRWAAVMLSRWFEGDLELGPMWAGESVELVREVLPAGEVVRRIATEADEVLARLSAGG